jgi:hypothetical protein
MMLAALAALTGAALLFNFLVNPYGAWRHRLVSGIFYRVRAGHERVITPYLLRTTQPTTLMLGTSRMLMGMSVEQGYKDGFLNAGLAAARPEEIEKEVQLALRNPHLKRIIWSVDFFTFDTRLKPDPATVARLDGSLRLLILDSLLNADAFDSSYHMLLRAISGRADLDRKVLEPIPWSQTFICWRFASKARGGLANIGDKVAMQQVVAEIPLYKGSICCSQRMAVFRRIVDTIRRAHVELIVFMPALSQFELEEIRQNGLWPRFQQWKRDIASIVPYWDFSGYNEVAHNDVMFMDVLHMKPAVGMAILRRLLGMPDTGCKDMQIVLDSGLWVDRRNVEQVLALQDQRERTANAEPNKYFQVVSEALTQVRGIPAARLSSASK